jgi:Mg2+/Co2+ transporter CorC
MDDPPKPSLLERLSSLLLREPEDRDQLVELLHSAYERHLLDADALSMIEGVLQVSETQVRDVMIPRSQMDMLDVEESPEAFIPFVIETAHSRFPVWEENRDNVIGILLAKDLLRFYAEAEFSVRDMLRPAVFVPENGRFRVKAVTEIADFNARFGTDFPDDDHDTMGGLVLASFGRLPKRGETVVIGGFGFQVLRADSRKILSLLVERRASPEKTGDGG